jgi:hypothetical protein
MVVEITCRSLAWAVTVGLHRFGPLREPINDPLLAARFTSFDKSIADRRASIADGLELVDMCSLRRSVAIAVGDSGPLGLSSLRFVQFRQRRIKCRLIDPSSQQAVRVNGDQFVPRGAGPVMVVITGGKFTMGSPEDEPDRNDGEGPLQLCTSRNLLLMTACVHVELEQSRSSDWTKVNYPESAATRRDVKAIKWREW